MLSHVVEENHHIFVSLGSQALWCNSCFSLQIGIKLNSKMPPSNRKSLFTLITRPDTYSFVGFLVYFCWLRSIIFLKQENLAANISHGSSDVVLREKWGVQKGRGKKCARKHITPKTKDIYGAYALLNNSSSLRVFLFVFKLLGPISKLFCTPFFLSSFARCSWSLSMYILMYRLLVRI